MLLARAHGLPPREYLRQVTGRDLAWQEALERAIGPLGEERQDWRIAWLAYWLIRSLGGAKQEITPTQLVIDLQQVLRERGEEETAELIQDDPDASAQKARQIEQQLLAHFPREG